MIERSVLEYEILLGRNWNDFVVCGLDFAYYLSAFLVSLLCIVWLFCVWLQIGCLIAHSIFPGYM